MIEALLSILLFSLGILALVGMQAAMTKGVTQAKLRSEASLLAEQLLGRMWLDQANLTSYAVVSGSCTATSYANCTSWLSSVNNTLPGGSAVVTLNGSAVSITITWQLPGESPNQLQIDTNVTN